MTGDREIAYTSLFGRLVLKSAVPVKPRELKAARARDHPLPVRRKRLRLPGRTGAVPGASTAIARGVIADELRQARIARNFRVKAPSGKAIASYHESYAVDPSAPRPGRLPHPSWLGHRSRGVAIDGLAPAPVFRVSGHGWVKVKTATASSAFAR